MMNDPCTYIIFGATGNLSRLKLMPALYHLEAEGRLPDGTMIIAVGRREMDSQGWLDELQGMLVDKARGGLDNDVFQRFSARMQYHRGDLNKEALYEGIRNTIETDNHFSKNWLSVSMVLRIPT